MFQSNNAFSGPLKNQLLSSHHFGSKLGYFEFGAIFWPFWKLGHIENWVILKIEFWANLKIEF